MKIILINGIIEFFPFIDKFFNNLKFPINIINNIYNLFLVVIIDFVKKGKTPKNLLSITKIKDRFLILNC